MPNIPDETAGHLAAIVESSDDAIVSKDLNGMILTWNSGAERLFGFTSVEAVGRSITLIIPEDRREEEQDVLARIRRGETVAHYETVRCRKNGDRLDISLTVSPIRAADGRIIGASKIARDITERKQLERNLENANRIKDEFLATLSHELRTPLNAILGYIRILLTKGSADGQTRRTLEIVDRNATALHQLVADMLDISRVVTGKVRLDVRTCDLPAIVAAAIDAVRPALDAKTIRLDFVADPNASPITGDPERLQQIFWNLLNNAVKFTPKRGRVQVRVARVNSHVEVTVSDTGIGISADFLPHLFERFRQADSGLTREHGGLGVGLALVRHFVELHGGRIYASSAGVGTGATFRIELPLMIVHPEPAPDIVRVHPRAGGQSPIPPVRLDGAVVLAVDDEPDSLLLVRDVLGDAGATVVTADSGAAALEVLDRQRVDVLIADLGMPGMDGYGLIAAVRQRYGPGIPAAALTAYARSEDRTRVLLAGFQTHLAKPIDPAELIAAVAALVNRRGLNGGV